MKGRNITDGMILDPGRNQTITTLMGPTAGVQPSNLRNVESSMRGNFAYGDYESPFGVQSIAALGNQSSPYGDGVLPYRDQEFAVIPPTAAAYAARTGIMPPQVRGSRMPGETKDASVQMHAGFPGSDSIERIDAAMAVNTPPPPNAVRYQTAQEPLGMSFSVGAIGSGPQRDVPQKA